MNVRRRILEAIRPAARGVRVLDVRAGPVYTAVRLEGERAGVAFSGLDRSAREGTVPRERRPPAGRDAADLVEHLEDSSPPATALGLATANALSTGAGPGSLTSGDVSEFLALRPRSTVAMVGFFGPLLPRLNALSARVTVFERDRSRLPEARSEQEAYECLGRFDVALITATSIVNHSVDRLLEAACGCREVVLLGASTPMLPSAFQGTPVTALSGVIVRHPDEVLRVVSEGGGNRRFRGLVRKVNIALPRFSSL